MPARRSGERKGSYGGHGRVLRTNSHQPARPSTLNNNHSVSPLRLHSTAPGTGRKRRLRPASRPGSGQATYLPHRAARYGLLGCRAAGLFRHAEVERGGGGAKFGVKERHAWLPARKAEFELQVRGHATRPERSPKASACCLLPHTPPFHPCKTVDVQQDHCNSLTTAIITKAGSDKTDMSFSPESLMTAESVARPFC